MEIYHRDNWIIIVHMATWKDLTKWNEENTIMNWINHMERIVKCVFPVPSRFQREGHSRLIRRGKFSDAWPLR